MRKCFLVFCLSSLLILMVGCWDKVELERNAFILGMAIDSEDDELLITFQIALLDAFKGDDSTNTAATQEISIKSDNIADAENMLLKYTGNIPNFVHCKLIIFGEEYSKKGIKDSLDFLFRESGVRRLTSVCVAKGRGKEVLEHRPKASPSVALLIDEMIAQNSERNNETMTNQNIGYLHQNFLRESDISLARVMANKEKLEVSGLGVFKDYKLVDWLSGHETMGVRLILGQLNKGIIGVRIPWDKGGHITLNAYEVESKTIPKIEKSNIKAKTNIRVEGDISQIQNPWPLKDSEKLIHEWEKAFEAEISKTTQNVFKKAKDEFNTDIFDLDEKIEAYYSKYWDENKGRWPELYRNMELDVDVDVNIRRVGILKP